MVMFLHFCRREREREELCVWREISKGKRRRGRHLDEKKKKKHKKIERKEKLVLGWVT